MADHKLCPFCGSKNSSLRTDIDRKYFNAGCDDCGAEGDMAESPEEAWNKWDARYGEEITP